MVSPTAQRCSASNWAACTHSTRSSCWLQAQVDFAYAHEDDAMADGAEASRQPRTAREARLWGNLFVYSLDAGSIAVRSA